MKWFKLDSNFIRDDKIIDLISKHGKEGFHFWLTILSLLAERYTGNPGQEFTLSLNEIRLITKLKQKKTSSLLVYLANEFGLNIVSNENKLQIKYPKFLEKQQKYSVSLGEAGFHRSQKKKKEVEVEKEVDTRNTVPNSKRDLGITKERGNKTLQAKNKKPPSVNGQAVHDFIAFWFDSYKKIYSSDYPRLGKYIGVCKRLVTDLGLEKTKNLATAYLRMRNQRFVANRHDLVTFELCLPQVQVFMDTGKNLSYQDLKNIEIGDANQRALNELLEKEIPDGKK